MGGAGQASVVDEDVDRADGADRSGHGVEVGHVERRRHRRTRVGGVDLGGHRFGPVGVQVVDRHHRAAPASAVAIPRPHVLPGARHQPRRSFRSNIASSSICSFDEGRVS